MLKPSEALIYVAPHDL